MCMGTAIKILDADTGEQMRKLIREVQTPTSVKRLIEQLKRRNSVDDVYKDWWRYVDMWNVEARNNGATGIVKIENNLMND